MKKINYNSRANFVEHVESNYDFYKFLRQYDVTKICEIPCGNGVNKDICNLFDYVYFYDINQEMVKIFLSKMNFNNCTIAVASIFEIPNEDFDLINIPRHAIQMFTKYEVEKIIESFSKLSKCRKLVFNLFNFSLKMDEYCKGTIYVDDIKTNKVYCRKTKVFKAKDDQYVIVHDFYDFMFENILFTTEITMYEYSVLLFEDICTANGLEMRELKNLSNDYENVYIIESRKY